MISSITWLVMLAVFSGLSMNLILQFGLGLKGIAFDESIGRERLLAGSGVLFATVIILWLIFSFIRSVLFLGLLEYVILFPVSSLVFSVFECMVNRFILKKNTEQEGAILFGDSLTGSALAGAALFITLNVAGSLYDALVLSLVFSCSTALVIVVVDEIRRRAEMEAVPLRLRGGPLALIAMGLLSLIFASGALMLFRVLGAQ
jgi:Na+-translocating ferredoxin:NAD+ oxidoreductase RnfA subunit